MVGTGGNLENNQPLTTGAAKLTSADFSDQAEVGIPVNRANATLALTTGSYEYDYYQTTGVVASNQAPSFRLTITNPDAQDSDRTGALTYEPRNNGISTKDNWVSVASTSTSGQWAWNGGLGIGSGGGTMTLAQWDVAFQAADSANYSSAYVLVAGVGTVGARNMLSYFDNVTIGIPTAFDETTYDFEVVPEPASLGLLATGAALMLSSRRRRG